jgi:hypothetical protein
VSAAGSAELAMVLLGLVVGADLIGSPFAFTFSGLQSVKALTGDADHDLDSGNTPSPPAAQTSPLRRRRKSMRR